MYSTSRHTSSRRPNRIEIAGIYANYFYYFLVTISSNNVKLTINTNKMLIFKRKQKYQNHIWLEARIHT